MWNVEVSIISLESKRHIWSNQKTKKAYYMEATLRCYLHLWWVYFRSQSLLLQLCFFSSLVLITFASSLFRSQLVLLQLSLEWWHSRLSPGGVKLQLQWHSFPLLVCSYYIPNFQKCENVRRDKKMRKFVRKMPIHTIKCWKFCNNSDFKGGF